MYRWLHIQTYMDMHWPTAAGTRSLYTITHARVGICLITDTWATAAGTTYIHTTLCTCGHVLFTCHTHGYDVLDTTHALEALPPALLEILQRLLLYIFDPTCPPHAWHGNVLRSCEGSPSTRQAWQSSLLFRSFFLFRSACVEYSPSKAFLHLSQLICYGQSLQIKSDTFTVRAYFLYFASM